MLQKPRILANSATLCKLREAPASAFKGVRRSFLFCCARLPSMGRLIIGAPSGQGADDRHEERPADYRPDNRERMAVNVDRKDLRKSKRARDPGAKQGADKSQDDRHDQAASRIARDCLRQESATAAITSRISTSTIVIDMMPSPLGVEMRKRSAFYCLKFSVVLVQKMCRGVHCQQKG
jgi:hypothetical protein